MSLEIKDLNVPLRVDAHGAVRIGPSRVTLHTVICAFKKGASPEEIIRSFDTLRLADVYAVIANYLNHREAIEDYLQEHERNGEAIRREIEAAQPQDGLRERLKARWLEKQRSCGS
jgi:uncharacterized protein (DUF433 family)